MSGGGDEELLEQLFFTFIAYYEAHICVHTRPFPGLLVALDELDRLGVKIAVVTNKLERLAIKLLNESATLNRFVTVIGRDTMGPGKAKPDPAPIHEMISPCGGGPHTNKYAAFVGDSHFDCDAARNAGIPSVACSFGFLNGPIENLGADAIINHFDELVPALRGL